MLVVMRSSLGGIHRRPIPPPARAPAAARTTAARAPGEGWGRNGGARVDSINGNGCETAAWAV
eukprot:COSAG02_NODE_1945_length_10305_cov_5.152165_7_plen_63_part_00